MNEAINTNEHTENVKTSGVWMIITAAFAGFWGFFDVWYLADAAIYLLCAGLVLSKQSKNALLVGLICYAIGWLSVFELLESGAITGLILRAYVTYIFWKGYMSAIELSKVHSGKQASFEYVS
jgi:hypothetical protein